MTIRGVRKLSTNLLQIRTKNFQLQELTNEIFVPALHCKVQDSLPNLWVTKEKSQRAVMAEPEES
jgi:hypothetical protein